MLPSQETCENCGREIGKLEKAYLWQNHVVCADCNARLAAQSEEAPPPQPASPREPEPETEKTLLKARPPMFRGQVVVTVLAAMLTSAAVMLWIAIVSRAVGLWALGPAALLILLGPVALAREWIRTKHTLLRITTHRTELRTGWLSQSATEVRHRDVRNIQVRQGFLDRGVNVGDVAISSSGQSGMELTASGFRSPKRIADVVRERQG